MSLPYKNPRTGKVNIWSKTFGHTNELDAGGHPYVGNLEHLHCNSSAGARYGNAKRARQIRHPSNGVDASADWS
jgi:hypothetical protein